MLPSPFKKIQKRISKTFQSAGSFISSVGATPAKQLRVAILEGDEQRAIDLYTQDQGGGKRLCDEVHPSEPFQSTKYGDQTPLHLATLGALDTVVMLFLEHGGNPEEPNGHDQTALHCVCMRGDLEDRRFMILENLLGWRAKDPLFGEMRVSVNHVDADGNIALHYAARSGLVECVVRLLERNSIISLVNKGQQTCCDEADSANHTSLADMLEAALVFQPAEDDLGALDLEAEAGGGAAGASQERPAGIMFDSQSLASAELYDWAQRSISLFVEVTSLPVGRVLAVLAGYDWDVSRALQEYVMSPDSALKSVNLYTPEPAPVATAASSADKEPSLDPSKQLVFEVEDSSEEDELNLEAIEVEGKPEAELAAAQLDLPPPPPVAAGGESQGGPGLCPICCDELRPAVTAAEALAELGSAADKPESVVEEVMRHALSCHAGHTFCLQCWASNSSVQIVENGAGALECPGYKCRECVDDAWAPVLFPVFDSPGASTSAHIPVRPNTDILNKLKDNKVRRIVDRQSSLMWCPVADCGCIVILPKKSETNNETPSKKTKKKDENNALPMSAICGRGHAFCTSCNGEAHSPCSCSAWMKWQLKIQSAKESAGGASADGSDLANALWVAANTKRCPKCKLPIEKDEGCNHMTCRKCRYEFCWVCMQDWGLHSQNTGGYFQCNRYVENEEKPLDNDDDDYVSQIYGDVGSSRREDMLVRRAGQRMERFLHHYTRFRSHDESFVMESKMHMDTLERLCRILMSSLDESNGYSGSPINKSSSLKFEKLRWLQNKVENPFSKGLQSDSFTTHGHDDNDKLLIEELRLLREHQKELQKGAEEEATRNRKSSSESKSWLRYVRDSLSSKHSGEDMDKKPSAAISIRTEGLKSAGDPEDSGQIVPTILLFAAKGDILDSNVTDFSESFGLGEAASCAMKPQSIINRLRGLDFLQSGFRELLKCRQILKGSFAFAYFYFNGDNEDGSRSYGHDMAIQTRKIMFEQGQADLNARTETLSDVVARRRLRASRFIIDQATKAARISRLAFERTLATCTSEIADIGEQRQSRRSSNSQNLRHRRPSRATAHETTPTRPRNANAFHGSALPPPPPDVGGTARDPRGAEAAQSSSEYLDQQLRIILQSLESLDGSSGMITGAERGEGGRGTAAPVPSERSPVRGSMGPPWSTSRSDTLRPDAVAGSPAPKASHSPSRKKTSNSLLSHPDRGLIEALQRDGLDDDQIRDILNISNSNSAEDVAGLPAPQVYEAREGATERHRNANLSASREQPASGDRRAEGDAIEAADEEADDDADADADMNMAILLSIQDPRLNDLTLRGETGGAVALASSVAGAPESSTVEENISSLISMGFNREEAQQALARASNDVEVAIHALLSNS